MAVQTTNTSAAAWSPDLYTFAPADVIPDALILQTSTQAGTVDGDAPSVRCAYVDDADATFTAEGTEIDEAAPALSEVLVHTAKITQLIRLSREQFGQAGTDELLSESVQRAITAKGNEAYIAQAAPTSPAVAPVAGLLNVTGVTAGDDVSADLDPLVDLIAAIEGDGGTASHMIVAPDTWASLRKLKTATGSNASLLGAGTDDAERRLLDLPVLVSAAVPATKGLVVDRTAIVSAVGPVNVSRSEHAYFSSDSVALRCTWRIGHAVAKPQRVGAFAIAAA